MASIMGPINLAGEVPGNASSLYARNLYAFIEPMIDKKTGALAVNWDDELIKGTLIAKDGPHRQYDDRRAGRGRQQGTGRCRRAQGDEVARSPPRRRPAAAGSPKESKT